MKSITRLASEVKLSVPADLSVGDLVRMTDERSPFRVGMFLGADNDSGNFLFGALDGEYRFIYWSFEADTTVLPVVSLAELQVRLDIDGPFHHQSKTAGSVSADGDGLMMCFKEAGSGITPKLLVSFSKGLVIEARQFSGTPLVFSSWALGTANGDDEFVEIARSSESVPQ